MFKSQTFGRLAGTASRYSGKQAILVTKHGKERALNLPFRCGLNLQLCNSVDIDTDLLGTFTGEIERKGKPIETARKKARLGMDKSGHKIGLANEGSFGPHPFLPFIAGSQEVIVFIDVELGIEVVEHLITDRTNYAQVKASSVSAISDFLSKAKFPSHALIVRPSLQEKVSWRSKLSFRRAGKQTTHIHKGITNLKDLESSVNVCKQISLDGLALIETDMRAHLNPTRRRVIRRLGVQLCRRLQSVCNECNSPGWGMTGVERGLPCSECGSPSEAAKMEIYSCAKCPNQVVLERRDGLREVEPSECAFCNP